MGVARDRKTLGLAGTVTIFGLLAPFAAAETQIIRDVAVVDVAGGTLLRNRNVEVVDGRIARIVSSEGAPVADGASEIVGAGRYLIPGLIDSHVHFINAETYGRLMIAHGVTLVRDLGGFPAQIFRLRDRLNSGEIIGPEMLAVGAILDGDPPIWPFSEVCTTAEEGRAAVRKMAKAGADQIKVYSRLTKEPFDAIVNEAHKHGLKAVGHIPAALTLDDAMSAGLDGAEHLIGFDGAVGEACSEEHRVRGEKMVASLKQWVTYPRADMDSLRATLKRVAESGMVQCPTLVVMRGIGRMADPNADAHPMLQYVPAGVRGFWKGGTYSSWAEHAANAVPFMQSMVGELHRAGVTLICGTDLANPNTFAGYSLHEEMAMFQAAGIAPADVLRSATLTPAEFMGVSDRLGSIETGKSASMVLLRSNPLKDVRHCLEIDGVFLRGKYFDRKALDGLLAEARKIANPADDMTLPEKRVTLDLPGEVIQRGRYVSTFRGNDSGYEDFVITRDDSGYHVKVHNVPRGFGSPFTLIVHADGQFHCVRAEWTQLTDSGVTATYTRQDDHFIAEARQNGETLEPQRLKMAEGSVFGTPAVAPEFLANNRMKFDVGESRKYDAIGFGYPSWRMDVTSITGKRGKDRTIERPDGSTAMAEYQESSFETPMGPFSVQSWSDERGVLLKSIVNMPFGEIVTTLE